MQPIFVLSYCFRINVTVNYKQKNMFFQIDILPDKIYEYRKFVLVSCEFKVICFLMQKIEKFYAVLKEVNYE